MQHFQLAAQFPPLNKPCVTPYKTMQSHHAKSSKEMTWLSSGLCAIRYSMPKSPANRNRGRRGCFPHSSIQTSMRPVSKPRALSADDGQLRWYICKWRRSDSSPWLIDITPWTGVGTGSASLSVTRRSYGFGRFLLHVFSVNTQGNVILSIHSVKVWQHYSKWVSDSQLRCSSAECDNREPKRSVKL